MRYASLTALVLFILTAGSTFRSPTHASVGVEIFPPDSNPYGLSYGEWSAKWWQWILSIPPDKNPLLDKTGEYCSEGQTDQNVFFLGGTFGGKVERTCTIPSDKAIFFPIVNIEADYAHTPEAKTEESLKQFVKEDQDAVTLVSAKVNESQLTGLDNFRVQSPLFNLTYPSDNIYGVNLGQTTAISEGTWIMIEPLFPGNYEINFKGVILDYTTTGPENFVTDVTYHIKVVPS